MAFGTGAGPYGPGYHEYADPAAGGGGGGAAENRIRNGVPREYSLEALTYWFNTNPTSYYQMFPYGVPGIDMPGEFDGSVPARKDVLLGGIPPHLGGNPDDPGGGRRRGGGGGGWLQDFLNGTGGRGRGGGGGGADGNMGPQAPGSLEDYLAGLDPAAINGLLGGLMPNDPMLGLQDQVMADAADNRIYRANPIWQQKFLGLVGELESMQGKLADLDPETAAQFDQMLAARKGELDMQFKDSSEDLLAAAYAGGTNQSTTFGDNAGRLLYGRDQLLRQVMADDAGQRIATRQFLTTEARENAALRGSLIQSGAETDLADITLAANQVSDIRNRRAQLLDSAMNRQSQERLSLFGDITDMWMGEKQLAEDARQFNKDLRFRYHQNASDIAVRKAQIAVENRRVGIMGRELDLRDKWHTQDSAFQRSQWLESIRQWNLSYGLDRDALSQGAYQYNQNRRDQRTNSWIGAIAAIAGAFI
jgi:hypothetical protein